MAKISSAYFCSECGYESSGWLGRCPGCGSWNTLVEERRATGARPAAAGALARGRGAWLEGLTDGGGRGKKTGLANLLELGELSSEPGKRVSSGVSEFDRALGGGFVAGSLILVGGDPGIGKSTLLLQVCAAQKFKGPILYVSGEESPQQIKLRAERLNISGKGLKLLPEICFERVAEVLAQLKPSLCVIDSIQTLYSEDLQAAPGSVSQVREVTAGLLRLAKALGCTIVLVGHVTKDGAIAGPRVLEHMVDCVMYFEGEQHSSLRILRVIKNRFGATNELGLFEMSQSGLLPLPNASAFLLSQRPEQVPGAAVSCCIEGSRPLLVEVQALTTPSVFGQAQRALQGVERSRLLMILAVLENKLNLQFSSQDVFVNVVGGLKIQDTASDLALAAALVSGMKKLALREQLLLLGEIGLTGELRAVPAVDRRVLEAGRLGFKLCILPGASRKAMARVKAEQLPDLVYVDKLSEAMDLALTRSK